VCSIDEDIDFSFLSPDRQLHLYRMVQESLTNIEKHSGAQKAVLVVRPSAGKSGTARENVSMFISISDDGKGLSSVPNTHSGLGLKSLRQRAVILGAKIDFKNDAGNGFMVSIVLPPPGRFVDRFISIFVSQNLHLVSPRVFRELYPRT
jgi:signal transduction histidine kinase